MFYPILWYSISPWYSLCYAPILTRVSARPPKICKKPQKFFSTHNATIDTLLSLRYLEDTPFEREEVVAPFLQYSENYLVCLILNLLINTDYPDRAKI